MGCEMAMRRLQLIVLIFVAAGMAAETSEPRTSIQAERWLTFDFPSLRVGVAEYDDGPTGATIFHFPKGAKVAVDVRGGAPGSINTDTLRLSYESAYVDAITFAGGSSYGLSVATGVAQAIRESQEHPNDLSSIATVAGAIIFDVGPRRYSTRVPDEALGRAAFQAAAPGRFPSGAHGAGRFAMQGGYFGDAAREYSGQGGAFRQIGPTKIAVFTVVNALGVVADRAGNVVRCPQSHSGGGCGTIAARLASRLQAIGAAGPAARVSDEGPTEATTLTVVVTNQKMEFWALQRLAVQVHTSMARAIQPFHTSRDGDVLFVASTDEIENDSLTSADLGVVAAELAWDAVLASVPLLEPAESRAPIALPAEKLGRYVGEYALNRTVRASVALSTNGLTVSAPRNSLYVGEKPVALIPVSDADFRMDNGRGDRLKMDLDSAGRVTGFTINPGHWPVRAKRVEKR